MAGSRRLPCASSASPQSPRQHEKTVEEYAIVLPSKAFYVIDTSDTTMIPETLGERWSAHSGGVCAIHFVWYSKYRCSVPQGAIATRLERLLRKCATMPGGESLELAIQPDHFHLLVPMQTLDLSPARSPFACSAIPAETPELRRRPPTLWSCSYFIGTVGHMSEETVERYVASQRGR